MWDASPPRGPVPRRVTVIVEVAVSGEGRLSSEVDGVPVFWPAEATTATDRGYLRVRTGLVDEPFVATGRTHAVEHLALAPLLLGPHDYNGEVSLLTTMFVVEGGVREQADFLGNVARSLSRLPTRRWSDERRILEVEARGRHQTSAGILLATRFGPQGYGSAGGHEWGLPAATEDDLAAWSRDRFTRQQAAVFLSGPPPAGFRLPLPDGPPQLLPPLAPVLAPGRSVLVEVGVSGPALSLLVWGHELDVALLCEAVGHRLTHLLRHVAAVSYSPSVRARHLGRGTFALTVTADCRPEDARVVTTGLLDGMHALAEGGPTEQEAARVERQLRRLTDDPDSTLGPTHRAVRQALVPGITGDDGTGYAADPHRAAALLGPALGDALLMVPVAAAAPDGWTVLPGGSPGLPDGPERYGQDDPSLPRRLVVTGTGIGLHLGADLYATVRWDAAVGVATWDDGSRLVLGADSIGVFVDPAHWPDPTALVALVDELAPEGKVAAQGHREVDEDDLRHRRELADRRRSLDDRKTEPRRIRRRAVRSVAVTPAIVVVAFLVLGVVVAVLVPLLGVASGVGAPLMCIPMIVWIWWLVARAPDGRKMAARASGDDTDDKTRTTW